MKPNLRLELKDRLPDFSGSQYITLHITHYNSKANAISVVIMFGRPETQPSRLIDVVISNMHMH